MDTQTRKYTTTNRRSRVQNTHTWTHKQQTCKYNYSLLKDARVYKTPPNIREWPVCTHRQTHTTERSECVRAQHPTRTHTHPETDQTQVYTTLDMANCDIY